MYEVSLPPADAECQRRPDQVTGLERGVAKQDRPRNETEHPDPDPPLGEACRG